MVRLVVILSLVVVVVLLGGAGLSHRMRERAEAEAAAAGEALRRAQARAAMGRGRADLEVSILDGLALLIELPEPGRIPTPIVFVRIEKALDRAYEVTGLDGGAILYADGESFERLDRDRSEPDSPLVLASNMGHVSFGFPLHEQPRDGAALHVEWTHVNPRSGEVELLRSEPVIYRRGPGKGASR